MRTFIFVGLIALTAAVGIALTGGLIHAATEHLAGDYVIGPISKAPSECSHGSPESLDSDALDVKGKIIAVRPEKNEVVVSGDVKNWTFQLAKDAKVFINDRESRLASLKVGDEAAVTFDRQGPLMIATSVRSTRN